MTTHIHDLKWYEDLAKQIDVAKYTMLELSDALSKHEYRKSINSNTLLRGQRAIYKIKDKLDDQVFEDWHELPFNQLVGVFYDEPSRPEYKRYEKSIRK